MDSLARIPWHTVVTVVTTVGGYLLAFGLIARIVDQRKEAGATLAWILTIAFLPYLGALLYLLIGRRRFLRKTRKRSQTLDEFRREAESMPHLDPSCPLVLQEADSQDLPGQITRVACAVAETPLLKGNSATVYVETDEAYDRMEEAILGAKHHVHMMSYIFRSDNAGRRFRDLLAEKAKEGVEVRLLVDDVGSHDLDDSFVLLLENAGGKFARFMPVMPFRPTWRPNMRNHRKILVVDGKIGFTGGLNIGDEYQGRKKKFAPWRDTHMRLEGPAVWRLQEVFEEDWVFATDESLKGNAYFHDFGADNPAGGHLVQVVDSGPDMAHETIHAVFFTAITQARKHICITTPYFVPDNAMLLALKAAAWRGVKIKILLPGKSDMKLVRWAGRSFFRELLDAGVELYEHRPGMLHAKTMVVDGNWSTVGSANMDIRSFRLNFEINVLVSGTEFAAEMERIFELDIAKALKITPELMQQESRAQRFLESFCRVLSPVL
jgi:cardiolipin synthase A/B